MADLDAELQARLRELDRELEEGDITRKGYEKRRTVIMSQFFNTEQTDELQSRLRIHNGDEQQAQGIEGSRNASFAALSGTTLDHQGNAHAHSRNASGSYSPASAPGYPQTQVGRFQERQLGVRNVTQQPYPRDSYQARPLTPDPYEYESRGGTMVGSDYRFNPAIQPTYEHDGAGGEYGSPGQSRLSTMLDSQQGFFSDFAGQQASEAPRDSYGGVHRYSQEPFSPTAIMAPPMLGAQDLPPAAIVDCQLPLDPREVPFDAVDPHNAGVLMSKFDNLGAVLRHRGKTNSRQPAFWVLDPKGKETASITFEKLHSRAEKVAQVIKDKGNLYRGDRVALVYRDSEIIDFAVALLGCFLAGVVAVPMNNVEEYQKLSLLLTTTQAHLALTTDNNLKAFQRDISAQRLKWPTGVEWWKTNEFGSYHPKKKDDGPQLPTPDLAYIEFSRAPTGDLRGVVLSHRTIMHQMACMQAIISTVPAQDNASTDTFNPNLRHPDGSFVVPPPATSTESILSYLDPREGAGLILGILLGVYGGHTVVWMEARTVDTPGLYAHLISKYKATVMVADYPGLKRAAYNYQQDPMATRNFKKNVEPNFSSVKICLIDTLTIDCEFHELLADRWLRPLRNTRAREVVAPMLCLPEYGGMVISVRDWIGREERLGCPLSATPSEEDDDKEDSPDNAVNNGYSSLIGGGGPVMRSNHKKHRTELSEALLDKEALKSNQIVVVAVGDEVQKRANDPGLLRVGAFGYPIPDATLALVDPETNLLCPPYSVGEIWVDSPSLSGGFWALPKYTETIFHAKPYRFVEGNPTPVIVEPEFLRTGLLGCLINGKIYVLGLYEDRIRQRVEWVDNGVPEAEHRYFFVQHLVLSIMKNVLKIYDCSAFDSYVNGEYLPIILIETQAASTAPTTAGGPPRQLDVPFLESLSERVIDVLFTEHHLRVYCVMITVPNALPRIMRNGRREIGNMLCRKEFDSGTLACVHVKFGIERAVQNLPIGTDPGGGIWSPLASQGRQVMLYENDKQYSGVDYREVVMDDRTATPLNQFSNIHDLMQWRVSRQSEELAYCSIDGRGKEGKGVNWKKFDQKVAAVALYLKNKAKVQPGDHIVLMYTHSEDFVYAVHACFCLGAVLIPMAPVDQNRLNEDAPALLHIVADFKVKAILVNHDVDAVLKLKPVSQHLKQSAVILRVNLPGIYNTTKPGKDKHGCRDLGLTIRPQWVQHGNPVLIWVYWTPDQRRIAVQLGHDTIMAVCKVQKETCQMTSMRPILGCVRSTVGLGFVHTCLMGIFLSSPTYLVSPVDFSQNPNVLFQTLSRYKIKDTYATSQMLDYAMAQAAGKSMGLHELKNLMITTDGRPRVDVYQKVRLHFSAAGLDRTAINTIYSHVLNPMVASRSYMCIEPIELWLDRDALRRGLIVAVHPDSDSQALLIQDSGMVPVSTQISIVNPETNRLCYAGEYGEIWVQSEANVTGFYGSKDIFDKERFNGRTIDGDPGVKWMRTGDLGFLHTVNRPIGPGGNLVEMQILFVLGSIGETFEVNGLLHFPMDIEASVERCHRNIASGGCAVFQAGGLVVVLVEILRKNFLASIVPVIVNTVLNQHQLVVDIVAFVSKGDFPRSRLGEKQRGKILAGWVTRKMQTIAAQFAIRETDDGFPGIAEERSQAKQQAPSRAAGGRRSGSVSTSMTGGLPPPVIPLQHATPPPGLQPSPPKAAEAPHPTPAQQVLAESNSLAVELPAPLQIPELPTHDERSIYDNSYHDDVTPTGVRHGGVGNGGDIDFGFGDPLHYSPIDPLANPYASELMAANPFGGGNGTGLAAPGSQGRAHSAAPPEPTYTSKPYVQLAVSAAQREGEGPGALAPAQNLWGLPSQVRRESMSPVETPRASGMGASSSGGGASGEGEEWPKEALDYMNFAGNVPGHYGAA
ncbi:acetyl-CoA synthetase-like protein [Trichodelitschia bisporula]|uniref:Acetyl-CoA synthetase-like protein n=1 Tax=Trichodelitschia bisporula TaxID=703511 RepID=A0A6G1HKL0_9PEZI|nr:acetyl-CoA synthetase-like protein [Trichodelitschia bisporula]